MPQRKPEFDDFADDYEALLADPLRDRFVQTADFFAIRKWELIRQFYARKGGEMSNLRWLDVGCGAGDLLRIGAVHVERAVGCDPSPAMLKRCAGYEAVLQPAALELPFEGGVFSLVTAVCVYHHIAPSDRAALTREICRVLAPKGIAAIIEHNPLNPVTRLIVSRTPVDANAKLLTMGSARHLLASANLVPVRDEYFLCLPQRLYAKIPWVEAVLSSLPLGGQYAAFAQKPAAATAARHSIQ